MKKYTLLFLLTLFCFSIIKAVPLRTELSLNGTWDFTPANGFKSSIAVPDFWDAYPQFVKVQQAAYERIVTVPSDSNWQNKIMKLEFDAINFIAEIYIDNTHVGSHIGGWMPFSIDISKYIKSGQSFKLKIDVKGGSFQPIVDSKGNPNWPVGFNGIKQRWGIIFDVWLRAYGELNINDAFIQNLLEIRNLL